VQGIWLQVTLLWTTLLLVVPTGVLWWFTGSLVTLFSPATSAEVAGFAATFARYSLLWLLPATIFNALCVWMEAVEVVVPQTIISVVFVAINFGLNYLLVFGGGDEHLALGLIGSPIATAVSKILQLFVLLGVMYIYPVLRRCWTRMSSSGAPPSLASHVCTSIL
jgi:MATE family multidrug resistance protein